MQWRRGGVHPRPTKGSHTPAASSVYTGKPARGGEEKGEGVAIRQFYFERINVFVKNGSGSQTLPRGIPKRR